MYFPPRVPIFAELVSSSCMFLRGFPCKAPAAGNLPCGGDGGRGLAGGPKGKMEGGVSNWVGGGGGGGYPLGRVLKMGCEPSCGGEIKNGTVGYFGASF